MANDDYGQDDGEGIRHAVSEDIAKQEDVFATSKMLILSDGTKNTAMSAGNLLKNLKLNDIESALWGFFREMAVTVKLQKHGISCKEQE